MRDNGGSLDVLLARWHHLCRGDRKAILRQLMPEQRLDFEVALAAHSAMAERSPAGEGARKYAAYAVWLAEIFEAIGNAEDAEWVDGLMPTLAVRNALQEAHAKAEECAAQDYRPSLFDLARSAILTGRGRA